MGVLYSAYGILISRTGLQFQCMDHIIWTGHQMLKLASKFEMFIYFFVFCWIEKRTNCSAIFVIKSLNLFYILKVPQNAFYNNIKKHNNRNNFIFNTNFNILWPVQIT